MRDTLGILVATATLLLAAGCGSDSGTTGQAIDIGTPSGIDELVDGLARGGFGQQVRARVAATSESGGVTLEPTFTGKPTECFAAVTSIALVLVAA